MERTSLTVTTIVKLIDEEYGQISSTKYLDQHGVKLPGRYRGLPQTSRPLLSSTP